MYVNNETAANEKRTFLLATPAAFSIHWTARTAVAEDQDKDKYYQ